MLVSGPPAIPAPSTGPIYTLKGGVGLLRVVLEVFDNRVTIKREGSNAPTEILFASIVSVRLIEADAWALGSIRFMIAGDDEPTDEFRFGKGILGNSKINASARQITEFISQRAFGANAVATAGRIHRISGVTQVLEVFQDRVTITPKGFAGLWLQGLKGTKEIPFASIVAVQFREADVLTTGYIQFTIPGGNESTRGILAALNDENSFSFTAKHNDLARQVKEFISAAMRGLRTPQGNPGTVSLSDELERLARLKEQGILSEDEFQSAKRKLLG